MACMLLNIIDNYESLLGQLLTKRDENEVAQHGLSVLVSRHNHTGRLTIRTPRNN